MAKTSGELEKEFIDSAKEKTGKSMNDWLALVAGSGKQKQNEIMDWLKKTHDLNHLQSMFVAGIFLNNGNPVYINEDVLLGNQFAKCPDIRPLYDVVAQKILDLVPGTKIIPKKSYISFTADCEFAAINVKPKEIRLGMDLGERPFDGRIEKSKLTGPMPRISHMVILTTEDQFDHTLKELLQLSYQRCHKK